MKKIYLVSRTDTIDYDEYDSAIVCETSSMNAKKHCYSYFDTSMINIKCKLIGIANKRQKIGTILGSFNAG